MTRGPASHVDTIDLANVARTVKRGWHIVALTLVLGLAVAGGIIQFAPPKFRGKVSLLIRVAKERGSLLSQLSGLGDAGGGILGGGLKGALETESQLMTSRAVLGTVVDSFRLQARIVTPHRLVSPDVVQGVQLSEAFTKVKYHFERDGAGGAYRISGGGFSGQVRDRTAVLPVGSVTFTDPNALPPSFVLEVRDRHDAIDRLYKNVTVAKPGGELVTVTYKGDDSLSASRIANAVVAVYSRRRKITDRGTNQERVTFLSAQMDSISQQLGQSERALKRQQEMSGVLDPEIWGKVELEEGGALREKLTEVSLEEGALRPMVERARADGDIHALMGYPSFLKSAAINALIADLNRAESEGYALRATHGANTPEVQAVDSSIRNIERKLLPLATSYLGSLSKQRHDLEAKLDTIQMAVAALPATAEVSLRLQRDILGLSKMYQLVQTQLVDARLAALSEGGDMTVFDPAEIPKKVWFPQTWLTLGTGAGAGLIVGIVAAVIMGTLGRWLRDPYDVELSTGVPTLTFDPHAPLMVTTRAARTVLVAPLGIGALAGPVVERLAQTAASRSLKATVLDLTHSVEGLDLNGMIARLEENHDLVIVHLPGLVSDAAAAALRESRPVLLVTPERRVARTQLAGAVQLLQRLDIPCAGIVMNGTGNGAVNGTHARAAELQAG